MVTYKTTSAQEPPRRYVVIQSVNVSELIAIGQGVNYAGTTTIDLSVFNPPIIQYPRVGEYWFIALLKQKWVLDKKGSQGSEGYLTSPVNPGDEIWNVGNDLNQTVQGNYTSTINENVTSAILGNYTSTVGGTFSLTDATGTLKTQPPTDTWHTLPLVNSWVVVGTYHTPQYKKVEFGNYVILRGRMQSGTSTTFATLPTGYQPPTYVQFPCAAAPTIATGNMGRVDITSAGVMTILGENAIGTSFSLDGIFFSLDS
jgi:hypothetical protein